MRTDESDPDASGELRAETLTTLLDWKRRICALYQEVRSSRDPEKAWGRWRAERDALFSSHPQSPLRAGARNAWPGLQYFDYDHTKRVLGEVRDAEPEHYDISTSGKVTMGFTRVATVWFHLDGRGLALELYWLDGYGGGLFVPFRDATSGVETYGAGRYVLDTVKGADLGMERNRLVLDFNFAYNPSCAYDARWVCPLAPPPNRLDVAITAGERA